MWPFTVSKRALYILEQAMSCVMTMAAGIALSTAGLSGSTCSAMATTSCLALPNLSGCVAKTCDRTQRAGSDPCTIQSRTSLCRAWPSGANVTRCRLRCLRSHGFLAVESCHQIVNMFVQNEKTKRYPWITTSACARPSRVSAGQGMGSSSQVEPASAERKSPLLFAA